MKEQLRVNDNVVGVFVDRIPIKDMLNLEKRSFMSAIFERGGDSYKCVRDIYYDYQANIMYSAEPPILQFLSPPLQGAQAIENINVKYSFEYHKTYSNASNTYEYINTFENHQQISNLIRFFNGNSEKPSLELLNLLEMDYFLSKQIFGRKSRFLEFMFRPLHYFYYPVEEELEVEFEDEYALEEYFTEPPAPSDEFYYSNEYFEWFKEMIKGFDDTKEFSYKECPRYFLNYFIDKNNLDCLYSLTEKNIEEAFRFLKRFTNLVLYILDEEPQVDVSADLKENMSAFLYRSLEVKLTFGKFYLDEDLKDKIREDKSLKIKVYDNSKNEIPCESLKCFNFGASYYIPLDEIIQKDIHFVSVFYEGKFINEVSLSKYREMAVEGIKGE